VVAAMLGGTSAVQFCLNSLSHQWNVWSAATEQDLKAFGTDPLKLVAIDSENEFGTNSSNAKREYVCPELVLDMTAKTYVMTVTDKYDSSTDYQKEGDFTFDPVYARLTFEGGSEADENDLLWVSSGGNMPWHVVYSSTTDLLIVSCENTWHWRYYLFSTADLTNVSDDCFNKVIQNFGISATLKRINNLACS